MCGIAVIYAYKDPASAMDRSELRCIRDHMIARGPDGKGEWYSDDNRVALGHRRLAIIDLDERAAQPMLSDNGQFSIAFNGEIYNFRELRAGLEQRGHHFRTESDTEVLLHLYAEKGEAMLNELRGMFAFIIWDQERKTLFMARDPYGIKPLYYADDGRTIRAASQVKALLAGGQISQDQDPAGIVGFYLFGSVPEPFTMYKQIRQIPAGHYMWADESGAGEPQEYFSIAGTYAAALSQPIGNAMEIQEITRTALLDSVRHHLVADVPVGAFLSAGIDSGALVGLMRDAGAQDIQTVTLAFEEFAGSANDESSLAAQVAKKYGTRHTTRRVGQHEFEQDLPKILAAMDQPTIDGINTWFVSKASAEQGLKVAVSGLGGDELFGGYPSFKDIPRWLRWFRIPGRIPMAGPITRKLLCPFLNHFDINPKAAGMLELGGTWEGAYLLRRGLFMPWELPSLLGDELAREGMRKLRPMQLIRQVMEPGPSATFARVASMESTLYMRNQLLRDSDWAGMAHSMEIRVPLVDAKLLTNTAKVAICDPAWSKQRLAVAPSKQLPEAVTQREKTGFTTPIDAWAANSPKGQPTNLTEKSTTRGHWARMWSEQVTVAWKTGNLT